MAPNSKRPPPLPKMLFEANGPLAPGSARLPPSPSSVHPSYLIDAHSHSFVSGSGAKDVYGLLSPGMPRPPIKNAVQVVLDSDEQSPPVSAISTTPRPLSIHPTILQLNLASPSPPSMTNVVKSAIDLIVPAKAPLTEKEWDQLDEVVLALNESLGSGALTEQLEKVEMDGKEGKEQVNNGSIIISGLLPPPLTTDSDTLAKDPEYDTYIGRLNQLSLNPSVYLKALPPVVPVGEKGDWAADRKELERVLRMYLSPAIESFGTHRIIFGTSPAVAASTTSESQGSTSDVQMKHPIGEGEWYAVLRKAVTELGEGADAVNGIFGGTAAKVYDLPAE